MKQWKQKKQRGQKRQKGLSFAFFALFAFFASISYLSERTDFVKVSRHQGQDTILSNAAEALNRGQDTILSHNGFASGISLTWRFKNSSRLFFESSPLFGCKRRMY